MGLAQGAVACGRGFGPIGRVEARATAEIVVTCGPDRGVRAVNSRRRASSGGEQFDFLLDRLSARLRGGSLADVGDLAMGPHGRLWKNTNSNAT